MKAFLALGIRKSVPKLTFAFDNLDLFDLVDFDFFAKFAIVDSFFDTSPNFTTSITTTSIN